MTKDEALTLMQAITDKGANRPCSRCGNQEFLILGESAVPMRSLATRPQPTTADFPVVILGCRNCGWISMHSIPIVLRIQAEEPPPGVTSVQAPYTGDLD